MNVKELRKMLISCADDTEILVCGCYSSEGTIENAYIKKVEDNTKKWKSILVLESDICSG